MNRVHKKFSKIIEHFDSLIWNSTTSHIILNSRISLPPPKLIQFFEKSSN